MACIKYTMKKKLKFLVIFSILIIVLIVLLTLIVFPRRYNSLIVKYASEYNLPSSMVASVINVESGYDEKSVSKAGAIGLMQILPTTAEDCAQRLGVDYADVDLFDMETNMRIGCFYLSYLLSLFEGNVVNALCAYNWGLGNVNEWMRLGNQDNSGTITNIPIPETKNYVFKFKLNYFVYDKIYKY